MDKIIAKYLKGDLSLEEQVRLLKWLEEDEHNAELLRNLKKYWDNYPMDLSKERDEVENRIMAELNRSTTRNQVSNRINHYYIFKVAAILVVVLATVITVLVQRGQMSKGEQYLTLIEKVSQPGQTITTKLPDGTIVKLNSDSKLTLPKIFGKDTREVTLSGEAFFEVEKDKSRPFIVHTKNFEIRVLGTSFNVNAYPDGKSNYIAVRTGTVNVDTKSNGSVELNPDSMVNVTHEGSLTPVTPVDDLLIYGWIDKQLVFKDNSLEEVFDRIEKWYGVKVVSNEDIRFSEKLFNATFNRPALNEVLTLISKVYQIDYTIEEDNVIIKTKPI